MILLQAGMMQGFLLMVFMGAVLVVGLPLLATLYKKQFNRYVPTAQMEQRPFYFRTISTMFSVGLAVGTVALFLFLVFIVFG